MCNYPSKPHWKNVFMAISANVTLILACFATLAKWNVCGAASAFSKTDDCWFVNILLRRFLYVLWQFGNERGPIMLFHLLIFTAKQIKLAVRVRGVSFPEHTLMVCQSQCTGPANQSKHISCLGWGGFIETGTKQGIWNRLGRDELQ